MAQRIATPNRQVNLWGVGKDGFRDGNKAAFINPTELSAGFMNMLQEELAGIAEAAGLVLDPNNNAQVLAALRSAGVFTTPAQFDNTTKAATTEFVQRALGNLSGYAAISSNTTLTAAHAGRGCYFSVAAVATLPVANTVPAGTLIFFTGFTSGATSVARQGTDTIAANVANSTLTSIVILDGEDLILESNGSTQWIAVGGSARLKYAGGFGSSLATSGYQKLPSGLIVQWGSIATSASVDTTVTFPIAFPTAVYSGSCTPNTGGFGTFNGSTVSSGIVNAWSAVGTRVALSISWIAIGK